MKLPPVALVGPHTVSPGGIHWRRNTQCRRERMDREVSSAPHAIATAAAKPEFKLAENVLVQPEVERGRPPLVSYSAFSSLL